MCPNTGLSLLSPIMLRIVRSCYNDWRWSTGILYAMTSSGDLLAPESTDLLAVQTAALLLSSGEGNNLSMLFCFLWRWRQISRWSWSQKSSRAWYNNRRLQLSKHNKVDMSFMKQQFVINHTIPALLGSCVKNTTSGKILCPQESSLFLYFRQNKRGSNFGLLRIYEVFYVSCKTVYRWVTTNCCFISDISVDRRY